MDDSDIAEMTLTVDVPGYDAEEVQELTRHLRSELRDLPIESVDAATGGTAPAGSKSGELILLGVLALKLTPIVVRPLVDFLKTWVKRKEGRKVTLKTKIRGRQIELRVEGGVPAKDVDAFVQAISAL
jgi:hypothetical protein